MKFAEAIRPRRSKNASSFENYVNNVSHLIAFYLRRAREGREGLYSRFTNSHFTSNAKKNRIITFNYDDVLDNILLREHQAKNLYFSKIEHGRSRKPKDKISEFPLLLKLHGSVNWNCHTDQFKSVISNAENTESPLFLDDVWLRLKGCPAPDDEWSPCIIPPIEAKPITSVSLFRFLWTRACEYLHECRELIVCGYSLPPTDALAASLFKEFNNKRLKTVTVVDPDPAIMSKWHRLLSRKNVARARKCRSCAMDVFR